MPLHLPLKKLFHLGFYVLSVIVILSAVSLMFRQKKFQQNLYEVDEISGDVHIVHKTLKPSLEIRAYKSDNHTPNSQFSAEQADKLQPKAKKQSRNTSNRGISYNEDWKKIKVFCFVISCRAYYKRCIGVNKTWGRHCDGVTFFSNNGFDAPDISIGRVFDSSKNIDEYLPTASTYLYALDKVRQKYLAEYDWFLAADDLTYVVIENLKYFLYKLPKNTSVFVTQEELKRQTAKTIRSVPGFMINKHALTLFGKWNFRRLCEPIGSPMKTAILRCMNIMNIDKGDAIKGLKKNEYYGYQLGFNMRGEDYKHWPPSENSEMKTNQYPIFYHGLQERKFFTMEYLLYQARLWGKEPNESGELT